MQPALITKLIAAWPTERWRDVTVLIAVSGGADSVALARGLNEIRSGGEGRLVLAHFNHRLRGAESDADAAFVAELAEKLNLELVSDSSTDDLAIGGSGEGLEGAARLARYDFLTSAASRCGARYVATAHTADDNVETVLFNILRGTGLAGLAGIPRVRQLTDAASVIRPLLDVTRSEVLDYLQSIGQPNRDDSTNRLESYTRNRIRLQLLPLLERDYNPRIREALMRLAQITGQAGDCLRQQAAALFNGAVKSAPDSVEINLPSLADAHPAVVRQLLLLIWQQQVWPLQDMSQDQWRELAELVHVSDARSAQDFPGGIRAEKRGAVLQLTLG